MNYGWANYQLFESRMINKIRIRNKLAPMPVEDNNISIFNPRCHPYLEAGIFTIGHFLDINKEKNIHDGLFFKL